MSPLVRRKGPQNRTFLTFSTQPSGHVRNDIKLRLSLVVDRGRIDLDTSTRIPRLRVIP